MANESIYLNGQLSQDADLSGHLSEPLQVLFGTLMNPQTLSGSLSNATLRGKSAYEIAVEYCGYEGSIESWIESLRAKQIEIRNNNGIIEYKYDNQYMWTVLIDLSSYTDDYELLENRPSLDGQVLSGNRDLWDDYLLNESALTNMELEDIIDDIF